MVKLGPYQVHPVADLFPLIEGDEFDALVEDIKHRGLQEPITITADGLTLVDGRNRYRACDALNIEPLHHRLGEWYTDDMIRDHIISANLRRRHLSVGQLSALAFELTPFYAKAAKQRQREAGGNKFAVDQQEPVVANSQQPFSEWERKAVSQSAAAVGTSGKSVSDFAAIHRDAPDLADKVRKDEMSLNAANTERKKRIASQPKPEPKPKPNRADPITLTLHTHDGQEIKYPQPQSKPTFNETPGDGISWAAWSWNPVTGCLHGCKYCYARDIATSQRFANAYPAGFTPLFHHERLTAPANTKIPHNHADDPSYKRVFVCSMADLYGRWVPDEWIEQVHNSMLESPQWQYITLTKFPDRYQGLKMPDGAWVGTSVDEQKRVRIAERAFRELPDTVTKWLSLEPLLEPLEFEDLSMFDWVVIGAQTQTRQPDGVVPAFDPPFEWVARIVLAAREAGCKIHMKPNLGNGQPGMRLINEFP